MLKVKNAVDAERLGLGLLDLNQARMESLRLNVEKMRFVQKHHDTYQEGWDDAVCVVLDLIDIYRKGMNE